MSADNSDCRPVVAVFDFDGTLTTADSLLPFLREGAGAPRFWGKILLSLPVFAGLALRLLPNHDAKERLLGTFLRDRPQDQLEAIAGRFATGRLARLLNPLAIERLRWHQGQSHRVILLSASPEIYLRVWGKQFGVEEIVATKLKFTGGLATGRIAGRNCHGPEKVTRLTEHLAALNAWRIVAYADGASDRFLLAVADEVHYRTFWTRSGWWQKLHQASCLWRALW